MDTIPITWGNITEGMLVERQYSAKSHCVGLVLATERRWSELANSDMVCVTILENWNGEVKVCCSGWRQALWVSVWNAIL